MADAKLQRVPNLIEAQIANLSSIQRRLVAVRDSIPVNTENADEIEQLNKRLDEFAGDKKNLEIRKSLMPDAPVRSAPERGKTLQFNRQRRS